MAPGPLLLFDALALVACCYAEGIAELESDGEVARQDIACTHGAQLSIRWSAVYNGRSIFGNKYHYESQPHSTVTIALGVSVGILQEDCHRTSG